jgi:hypothetical protein
MERWVNNIPRHTITPKTDAASQLRLLGRGYAAIMVGSGMTMGRALLTLAVPLSCRSHKIFFVIMRHAIGRR